MSSCRHRRTTCGPSSPMFPFEKEAVSHEDVVLLLHYHLPSLLLPCRPPLSRLPILHRKSFFSVNAPPPPHPPLCVLPQDLVEHRFGHVHQGLELHRNPTATQAKQRQLEGISVVRPRAQPVVESSASQESTPASEGHTPVLVKPSTGREGRRG